MELAPYSTFEGWKQRRQLARTNLLYLCNNVLGYTDVSLRVHQKILNNLQRFEGGTDTCELTNYTAKPNQFVLPRMEAIIKGYKPAVDFRKLKSKHNRRKFLNMIPRAHLKSSVITVAHSIQWVINYPNIRVCLDSHTDEGVKGFLSSVRKHFTATPVFRYLFPEHCPMGKEVNTFGNQEFFDTKARTEWGAKEHTFNTISLGKALAGPHYDVMFHDDLVDSKNVITPGLIESTKQHMRDCEPLVDKYNTDLGASRGWEYLTGTFYDFSDLNYSVYEAEREKPEEARSWNINVQSAAPNYPEGPTLWPERFPIESLRAMEKDPAVGPALLAAQYLMNPIPPGSGLIESKDELVWTPRKVINELYARLQLYVAVDLAGMDENAKGTDNDYTAITLGGFGTDGHLYIIESFYGRPKPEEVIQELFSFVQRHPRILQIKIEKEAHARVLLPFLKREENVRGKWLPFLPVPRDNQRSKKLKIKGLQPWLKRGMIHFAEDLPSKLNIINEIMRFPKYNHDDFLDTLYDLFMERDGAVTSDVLPSEKTYAPKSAWTKLDDGTWLLTGNAVEATEEAIFGVTPEESAVDPFSGM